MDMDVRLGLEVGSGVPVGLGLDDLDFFAFLGGTFTFFVLSLVDDGGTTVVGSTCSVAWS